MPHGYFMSTVTSLQFGHTQPIDEVKRKIRTVPQGDQIIRGRGGKTNKYPVVPPGGGHSKYFIIIIIIIPALVALPSTSTSLC